MHDTNSLATLSDDGLLRGLARLVDQSRRCEAELVAHLAEVDARGLFARHATASMFAYCTQVLHLSEPEAYLRISAARASRLHPVLLSMLAGGQLHLSGVVLLAPLLTRDNRDALLTRCSYKSKREIQELVAAIAPRPDAAATIRKLPGPRATPEEPAGVTSSGFAQTSGPASAEALLPEGHIQPAPQPLQVPQPLPASQLSPGPPLSPATLSPAAAVGLAGELGRAPVSMDDSTRTSAQAPDVTLPHPREAGIDGVGVLDRRALELRPDGVRLRPAIEPLAPSRYKVQFTASAELRDMLVRLQALMRSEIPDGDFGAIIERAVCEKLQRLEARRFGAVSRRGGSDRSAQSSRPSQPLQPSRPSRPSQLFQLRQPPQSAQPLQPSRPSQDSESQRHSRRPEPSQPAPLRPRPGLELPQARRASSEAQPSRPAAPQLSRWVPAAVRRAVFERDAGRCTFVDAAGQRCAERGRLEYHHRHPYGLGGGHDLRNISLLCPAHNRYLAEVDYGKEAMARHRRASRTNDDRTGSKATGVSAAAPSQGRNRCGEATPSGRSRSYGA